MNEIELKRFITRNTELLLKLMRKGAEMEQAQMNVLMFRLYQYAMLQEEYNVYICLYKTPSEKMSCEEDPCTTIVTEEETTKIQLILDVNFVDRGTTFGTGVYNNGDVVTVYQEPEVGYHFVNWTENGQIISTLPSFQYTVTESVTLIQNFES